MQVGAWQGEDARLQLGDLLQRITQQRQRLLVELQGLARAFGEHPVQPAITASFDGSGPRRQVNVRQQAADFLAVVGIGLAHVLAGQPRLQQCRLLGQAAQGQAILGAQGVGHRQAGIVQDVEQFDEERQVGHRAALDQGQNVFALLQADEEIAVFAARRNTLEITQAPEPVGRQEDFELMTLQGGEYRHIRPLLPYQLKISHDGMSMSGSSERMKLPSLPSARTRK